MVVLSSLLFLLHRDIFAYIYFIRLKNSEWLKCPQRHPSRTCFRLLMLIFPHNPLLNVLGIGWCQRAASWRDKGEERILCHHPPEPNICSLADASLSYSSSSSLIFRQTFPPQNIVLLHCVVFLVPWNLNNQQIKQPTDQVWRGREINLI